MKPQNQQFITFLEEHKELRLWQSIYAFFKADKILVNGEDPFYFE